MPASSLMVQVSFQNYFLANKTLSNYQITNIKDELDTKLGKISQKKVAVLLDFVQMRGGGSCPNFCPLFTNCIYWVNLGMGREGADLEFVATVATGGRVKVLSAV